MTGEPLEPGQIRSVPPVDLAAAFHDAWVEYETMRQKPEGTAFEGMIDVGTKRYRYRALIEGSTGFEVEDEEQIAHNSIGDVMQIDGTLVFEGNIPGRFRVHGPVGLTSIEVDAEPCQTRRWFQIRWRPISE